MVFPTLDIENSLWQKGYRYVVGIDEVGRGSWAGPLVAAGVILPIGFQIPDGLADSKQVKPNARKKLSQIITKGAISTFISEIPVREIDKIGVGKATQEAFRQISKKILPAAEYCLIDAFYIKRYSRKKQMAVKGGDSICASISAASIVAKVYRDNLMKKLHRNYPAYGFAKHKGYGTKQHQEAIKAHGLSDVHRKSYDLFFLLQ